MSARSKYLGRYGVVAIHTERYPDRRYKRITVTCAQFIPSGRKYSTKGTFTKRTFDFPENSTILEHNQSYHDAWQFAMHVLGIYSKCVMLSNEDACEIVDGVSNFMYSIVKQKKTTFEKRGLSADGTYFEYCNEKIFHASMNRMIATYTHQDPKLVSGACSMISNYLDKKK